MVALFSLSAVTILAALALPAAALWLLLARGERLLAWIGAILLLGIAWLLRPRWHRIEAEEVVDPSTHPALVRLSGDVAREVGAPPPAIVAVDAAYNASVARAGWRQRRAITLGLPLAAALGPQDLVALLAHELGHLVNGDVTRSALVGAALTAAEGWVDVLTPRSWDEAGHRPGHRLGILLLWLLSLPAHAVLWTIDEDGLA